MPALADTAERSIDLAGRPGDSVPFGFLRIGSVDVAIALELVLEVVPRPPTSSQLLLGAGEPVGAMDLRGVVVPVADIRPRLGRTSGRPESDDDVVIVAHRGRVFGLLAEEVNGIRRIPVDDLRPVHLNDGSTALLSHTFLHPDEGHVVSVVDVDRLMALPEVPTVDSRPTESASVAATARDRRHLTLFRCADRILAVDVDDVHTVLPGTAPSASALAGGSCFGVVPFAGRQVAVVDPLAVTGIGRFAPEGVAEGAGMVLAVDDGFVVLAMTEPLDIVAVAPGEIQRIDPSVVRRPDLFDGMIEIDGLGICFVVDTARLRVEPPIEALATLTTAGDASPDAADDEGSVPADAGTSFVVFEIDTDHDGGGRAVEVAARLDEVEEILPHTCDLLPTDGHPAVLGVLSHRDGMVPVACLSTLVGRRPIRRTAASCLLLVRTGDDTVAFAVDHLVDIAPLDRRYPGRASVPSTSDDATVVTLGDSTRMRLEAHLALLAAQLGRSHDAPREVAGAPEGDAVPAPATDARLERHTAA
ncbi:chemotaxis protein CheW [Ilumatobacter sp.]|uniref:chemotaxis protein CheW n=1 Tax=Ilumatobacter sp. TaxID=1967498 RepID=UPI003B52C00A